MSPSAYIDSHGDQLLSFLKEMIAIPTVNPPGDLYGPATELLTERLQRLGLETKRYEVPMSLLRNKLPEGQPLLPRYNILGKWKVPGATKTIHFNSHYDVVPVSGKWKHGGPFSGAVDKGWIYGRGTADMKGSTASLVLALEALRACGVQPKMNVEVSVVADEETDSALGTGWLVANTPVEADYAVVMEGGEGKMVCCGHNGVCWLKVTVHGRAAHGSLPHEGINALEKMSALVVAMEAYKKRLAKRPFKTPSGKKMYPTVNIGGVFASGEGPKINTVPAEGSFTIDRRIIANENQVEAEKELRQFLIAAAKKIPHCRITIDKISENYPCFHEPSHPFFATMAKIVRGVRKERTEFSVSHGFNDMYFFASKLKIPTIGYGPGGDDCHAVDERASVKELFASAKIYAELLMTFEG
jgi:succinyl-diaminopimelate desuccinylase